MRQKAHEFVQLNTVIGHLIVKTVLLWKIVGRNEEKEKILIIKKKNFSFRGHA